MTESCWWQAALLHAPDDALFTGSTRLQQLGLDLGPHLPMQMVVGRDLHRDVPNLLLHRTERLPDREHRALEHPELDARSVCPAAVFVEICRSFSVVDAVAVADWLVGRGHTSPEQIGDLCRREPWRAGADEAEAVPGLVDGASRSVQESRLRVFFWAARLPVPRSNEPVRVDGRLVAVLDWWWERYRLAGEYEGAHHQLDRAQYLHDIERYAVLRDLRIDYLQLTSEQARNPTTAVLAVHRRLVANGYDGSPPDFGPRFRTMGRPVPEALEHLAPTRSRRR